MMDSPTPRVNSSLTRLPRVAPHDDLGGIVVAGHQLAQALSLWVQQTSTGLNVGLADNSVAAGQGRVSVRLWNAFPPNRE